MHPSLEKVINIDNRVLLFHRRELSDYLKGNKNRLISIEVDLALSCTHRCPNCTFANQHTGAFLDNGILDKIIENLPEVGAKGMIITGGGEPCLHKGMGKFVREVSEIGVDITLTTNGQFIHKHFEDLMHNLKRIRFSIDGAGYHTFRQTHGMREEDFDQVIANLKSAVQYKREKGLLIDIGVSFLICRENVSEMASAVDFYKRIGVNFLHFKPMQLWDKETNTYYHRRYPESREVFSRLENYKESDFMVTISREKHCREKRENIVYSRCHGAHFNMIIGADAKVYTCCHFKYNPKYCYGDLKKETFKEIMGRIKSDITNDCFRDCKMDALNQFVEFAKNHQDEVLRISKELTLEDLPLGSKWL